MIRNTRLLICDRWFCTACCILFRSSLCLVKRGRATIFDKPRHGGKWEVSLNRKATSYGKIRA